MDRPRTTVLTLAPAGLSAFVLLAGCTASATSAPATPSPSAMMEHSAMPSESATMAHSPPPPASAMIEHSASPSAAAPVSTGMFHKVDGSATGSVALSHNADGTFTITLYNLSIASAAHTH